MQRVMLSIDKKRLLVTLRFLRQFSPSWVLGMLVLAFLLASALSLLCSQLFLPGGTKNKIVPARFTAAEGIKIERRPVDKSVQTAILDRNIFNSEGKVGDSIDGPTKAKVSDKVLKTDLPLALVGVIFSGDPFNGLAMIEVGQNKKVTSYMIGDKIQDDAFLYQVWDDRIILERGGSREYLELKKFEIVSSRQKKPAAGGRPGTGGISTDKLATAPTGNEFKEDGFERKSNNIKLTEEYKRNLLSPDNLTKVLQDAKAEPNVVGGQLQGFKLTRIRENSVYEKAGFQNGDIIEEINGIPLRDAGGAIRLLNQLRNEKEIEVRLNRSGQVSNLAIQVQ
ncbi:MAG: PDZ domain-containing protein [Proteobacteria bacterium]|nr:MAG: PDZ domain-containing protein [Pseudomonadota bacterium]